MLKACCTFLLLGCLEASAPAQQPVSDATRPVQNRPQARAGFITPSEVNVKIDPDVRTFVVMAALNAAGFDYETGAQPLSPARAELRKDLARLDPQVKEKLAAYYKAHRRAGVDEAADAARYAALSLMMTPPPAFTVYQAIEQGEHSASQSSNRAIPEDLQPLLDFVPLVREFYVKSGIRELIPKYLGIGSAYAAAYRTPVGELIYEVLGYFHAAPETVISMRPLVVRSPTLDAKSQKSTVYARNRSRQVFVIPEPLAAMDTSTVRGDILNQKEDLLSRRVGDDYIVIVGPSRAAATDAVRQAMIRFVIDPMVERHLRQSLEYKDPILKLVASAPAATKQYSNSVYLIVRESLAQATEIRLHRLRAIEARGNYTEDEATYDLAQAYLRGAVLSFHFYESLMALEKVGIGIEDFFDQMVATAKFDREAARPREFESLIARISANRSKAPRTAGGEGAAAAAVIGAMASKILTSDNLIREKRFAEARSLLDEVLAIEPDNARALYGMAQVTTQVSAAVELDPKADENDKIQAQHDRLERAIKLYHKAIDNASKENERWLIQWSYVFLGRIYDFQEFRADAILQYEKAIAMGSDIPNGAYKEALEGKERPFGQK
ncbi:MAG TPA: tetratricopeptide repeat protein [Blastocatellia bacterium]|nr:tetratricopeptide repeat protein [Blastocatellia bacterium]